MSIANLRIPSAVGSPGAANRPAARSAAAGRSGSLLKWLVGAGLLLPGSQHATAAEDKADEAVASDVVEALPPRTPWTSSRVVGSPEPPPPFIVEKVFADIDWGSLVYLTREPGSDRLIVIGWPTPQTPPTTGKDALEQEATPEGGRELDRSLARILRVRDGNGATDVEVLLAMDDRHFYSLAFHPKYASNGQVFVCSKRDVASGPWDNVLSRFTVGRDAAGNAVYDPASEVEIIRWASTGHDGAAVAFGHDGMLYVTTGDGTGDSDDDLAAQDVSNLQGAVLRLDVDHPAEGETYSIPKDNPFVDLQGARGEIWSLGHRNPWRIDVDEKTGHIWVGNNGQDLWEYAHLVRPGDNCGWSIYEGSHPFYLQRQRGPGTFAPPTVEHDHSEFRSLTGGVVYYGRQLPDLEGAYVYGDYATGAIWGVYHDGERVVWNRKLAQTNLDIVAFSNSHRGELLVVGHAAGIYRLLPSQPDDSHLRFPRRLSDTGLFTSTAELLPAPGVYEYMVNASGWNDGAVARRWIGVPDGAERSPGQATSRFPEGTVFAQTLFTPQSSANTRQTRRIETRLLTLQRGQWAAYTYRWNDKQDDAELIDAGGAEFPLHDRSLKAESAGAEKLWRTPSRADCMSCHSRAAEFVLGFSDVQLSRPREFDGVVLNQLDALRRWDLIKAAAATPQRSLVDPYDDSADVEARVRSYLHVNCSVCHVAAGGGNARMQLDLATSREEMRLIDAHPQHETFGLLQPRLVAPGAPERSVMLHRLARRGAGQMPPRGSDRVDRAGVDLLRSWISQLPPTRKVVNQWTFQELSAELDLVAKGRSFASGKQAFHDVGCAQCHRFAGSGGGAGPELSRLVGQRKLPEILESILEPSKQIAPEFASEVIQTIGGETIVGRIQQEDETRLIVVPDAAHALAEPRTLLKREVENRTLSPKSRMPSGLLDTLETSRILDLLAYLKANANPDDEAFQP